MEFLDINGLKTLIGEIKSYIKEKAINPLGQKVDKAKFKDIIGADPNNTREDLMWNPAWSIGSGDSLFDAANKLDETDKGIYTILGVDRGQKITTDRQYQIKGSHTVKSAIDAIDVSLEDLEILIEDESSKLKNNINEVNTNIIKLNDLTPQYIESANDMMNYAGSEDNIGRLLYLSQSSTHQDTNVEYNKGLYIVKDVNVVEIVNDATIGEGGEIDLSNYVKNVSFNNTLGMPAGQPIIPMGSSFYYLAEGSDVLTALDTLDGALKGVDDKISEVEGVANALDNINDRISNIETAVNEQGNMINSFVKVVNVNLGDITINGGVRRGSITKEEYNALIDSTFSNKLIHITGEIDVDIESSYAQGINLTAGGEEIANIDVVCPIVNGLYTVQAPFVSLSGKCGFFIGSISFYKEGAEYIWHVVNGSGMVKIF